MTPSEEHVIERIVFFDGVCHVCNTFVDFILKRDLGGRLVFAPLQGSAARAVLGAEPSLHTVVYARDGVFFSESTAVLMILRDVGGIWRLASVGFLLPRFLRDFIYRIFARNRYVMFGQKDSCRIPSAAERSRFLD